MRNRNIVHRQIKEYCTSLKSGIMYIMPFLKMKWSRLSYIRLLYYMGNRNIVHHRIKEYCTSLKSGILYIIEIRNIVQHRKQEFCTTEKKGILYIAHMMRSVNGIVLLQKVWCTVASFNPLNLHSTKLSACMGRRMRRHHASSESINSDPGGVLGQARVDPPLPHTCAHWRFSLII